jgi:TonB family protein
MARKIKTRVVPTYPEIARRMGISGTVRLTVVVAPNGSVKTTTAMGGHPLLLNAAMDAVKKWKFESAAEESTGTIEIKFNPQGN